LNASSLFNKNQKPVEGREDAHTRHPEFSLNVIREDGNEAGVLYGLMLCAPYFDPSRGIRFVFEGYHIESWDDIQDGTWLVTITGSNLQDISNHLKASKLSMIRLGGDVTGFSVEKVPGKAARS